MQNLQLIKDIKAAPVIQLVVNDNIIPQERLKNSLRKLAETVEDQQKVTLRFKATTLELKNEFENLETSMKKLQSSLGRVDVKKLAQKAGRLAAIMEPHALHAPKNYRSLNALTGFY